MIMGRHDVPLSHWRADVNCRCGCEIDLYTAVLLVSMHDDVGWTNISIVGLGFGPV
jgi:hypothetical protein